MTGLGSSTSVATPSMAIEAPSPPDAPGPASTVGGPSPSSSWIVTVVVDTAPRTAPPVGSLMATVKVSRPSASSSWNRPTANTRDEASPGPQVNVPLVDS